MAIQFELASNSGVSWNESGATSYTRAFDTTGEDAGDMLIVVIGNTGGQADNITCTYDGEDILLEVTATNADGFGSKLFWKEGGLNIGNVNLVHGTYGANRSPSWGAILLSGTGGIGAEDTFASNSTASSTADTLTTTANNSWHIAGIGSGGVTPTVSYSSADSTERMDGTDAAGQSEVGIFTDLVASAGANTITIDHASTDFRTICSLEVKEAAAAVAGVPRRRLMLGIGA